jgi:glycosyltransferase involved in cell wall biosynthesis
VRIAYVSADIGIPVYGSKGASIHICEMVRAMTRLDHSVTVFTARRGAAESPLPAEVVKVKPARADTDADLVQGRDARQQVRERYALAVSGAICEELVRRHAEQPFDAIYERYSLFSTAGVSAAQRLGIPCALEVNSPLVLEQQRYRTLVDVTEAAAVEQRVFSGADALLCVSGEVQAYAESRGAARGRSRVVPNAVDTRLFHPAIHAQPLPDAAGRKVIGFSGSLKAWHGLERLLAVFRRLAARREDVHLLVVGDGPLRTWVEGFAAGAGLEDRITISGWVDYAELPAWLTAMDIAAAPYPPMEDFYFSPLKLTEYMAAGRAVVASAIGQIGEQIRDGRDGLLVAADDDDGLYRALNRLLDDPGLRGRLGDAAVQAVSGRTWEENACRALDAALPSWRETGTG